MDLNNSSLTSKKSQQKIIIVAGIVAVMQAWYPKNE